MKKIKAKYNIKKKKSYYRPKKADYVNALAAYYEKHPQQFKKDMKNLKRM